MESETNDAVFTPSPEVDSRGPVDGAKDRKSKEWKFASSQARLVRRHSTKEGKATSDDGGGTSNDRAGEKDGLARGRPPGEGEILPEQFHNDRTEGKTKRRRRKGEGQSSCSVERVPRTSETSKKGGLQRLAQNKRPLRALVQASPLTTRA